MELARFKPAVPKYALMAMAGLLWTMVGLGLCRLGYKWVSLLPGTRAISFGMAGVLLALFAYRFSFSRIATKNIERLCRLPAKGCLFAFQAWRSYLIIGMMIGLGLALRLSQIPKTYLSIVYFAVGGALILASFHYYIYLWRILFDRWPGRPA
ncbi:MAG: hypothetical protein PVG01_09080 [Desulfobacterales bacterium]|jgi:hypothetical protein